MSNQPAASSHPSSIPKDQILLLTQQSLNLIIQVVNSAVAKTIKVAINEALDQTFDNDHWQPIIEFDNLTFNIVWDKY